MSNEAQDPTDEKSSTNIWLIVLVILGAIVVVALAALLGMAIAGGSSVSGPEVIPPPPDTSGPYVVANTYVNVRSGPGTNFPSYGVAPPGAQAPVIGVSPDGGWWQIQVPTDKIPSGQGWVSADYLTAYNTENVPVVEPPPPPDEIPIPSPPPDVPSVTTLEPVNVRSGPGTNYPSYGVVPIGTTLPAIGISADGGWYVVAIPTEIAPDGQGWIKGAYVQASNTENLPVVQPPPPP